MNLKLGMVSQDVAKWQKILGMPQTGIFDPKTDAKTREWQKANGLKADGIVGPKSWAKGTGETVSQGSGWYPPRPGFQALTSGQREDVFGKFAYVKRNSTDIKITDGWDRENIVKVTIPQLIGVEGAPVNGVIYFHKKGAAQIKAFFAEVEAKGLLHLVISWAGAFYPRFIRGSTRSLSNHSWGTAFDINASQNWLGQKPAAVGKPGSLLQLVPIANKHGFFWGGHFNTRLDGMHFELAKIQGPGLLGLVQELDRSEEGAAVDDTSSEGGSGAGINDELSVAPAPDPTTDSPVDTGMAEIVQSETIDDQGNKKTETSFSAPSSEASGIIDHVNSLGDRFQGLQSTLEKFGIANPLASTSAGTWVMLVFKAIFAALVALVGFMKENIEYILISIIILIIIAFLYERSRKRVATEKAGVPVEILEKVLDKQVEMK